MAVYHLNEADVLIPDGWEDSTINAFSIPARNGAGASNLVITRDAKTRSADVRAYADQQLVEAAKKLKAYRLIGRRETQIAGRPAVEVDYVWTTPERIELQQRQAYLEVDGVFLAFTLTARHTGFAAVNALWAPFLDSVRLRAAQ